MNVRHVWITVIALIRTVIVEVKVVVVNRDLVVPTALLIYVQQLAVVNMVHAQRHILVGLYQ